MGLLARHLWERAGNINGGNIGVSSGLRDNKGR